MTGRVRARPGLTRAALLLALGLAVLVQLVVLYAPTEPAPPPFPNADKLVHATVFLVPTLLGLLARLPARWVVGVLAVHAGLSEVLQATPLVGRDGDPFDALADLAGIGLAVVVVVLGRRRGMVGGPRRRW